MELREGGMIPTRLCASSQDVQVQGFPLEKVVGWEWMGVLGARLSCTRALPKLVGQAGAIHPTQRQRPPLLCLPPEKPSPFLSIHLPTPALNSLFEGLAIRMLIMPAAVNIYEQR